MITKQKIDDMPDVLSIIHDAEKKIKAVCGTEVILQISAIHLATSRKQLIQDIVCHYFDIAWHDIESQNRVRPVTNARHAYMYLLRMEGYSLEEIGADCGRDHTTVMHAVKKVKGFYKTHDELADDIEDIKKLLPATIL